MPGKTCWKYSWKTCDSGPWCRQCVLSGAAGGWWWGRQLWDNRGWYQFSLLPVFLVNPLPKMEVEVFSQRGLSHVGFTLRQNLARVLISGSGPPWFPDVPKTLRTSCGEQEEEQNYHISFFFFLSIKQDLCLTSLFCNYPPGFISDGWRNQYTSRTFWLLRRVIAVPPDCLAKNNSLHYLLYFTEAEEGIHCDFVPFQETA